MTQEQEIQEVIKKNLPQHVGETLKKRLEQADEDAKLVVVLTDTIEELHQTAYKKEIRLNEYEAFDVRNSSLDLREKELEKERNTLELEKLKYQLQSEKDKTIFSQNLAMGLVRNTEYRKNIFDTETSGQPILDGNGHTHYPIPTTKNHITTEIQE